MPVVPALALVMTLQAAAPLAGAAAASSPAPRPYVDGFCLAVAAGAADGDGYYRLIADWGARPMTGAQADAASPVDQPVAGQPFTFEDAGAPHAFVDVRHGTCALVYPGATPSSAALAELADGRPSTGDGGAPERWRSVSATYVGRPRPARWFLQVGRAEGQGVCADDLSDLRRRDGAAVSVLRLAPCKLGADERAQAR